MGYWLLKRGIAQSDLLSFLEFQAAKVQNYLSKIE